VANQVLSLNGELGLSVTTRRNQGAPVEDICGFDLEIMQALDMQRRLERLHQK